MCTPHTSAELDIHERCFAYPELPCMPDYYDCNICHFFYPGTKTEVMKCNDQSNCEYICFI